MKGTESEEESLFKEVILKEMIIWLNFSRAFMKLKRPLRFLMALRTLEKDAFSTIPVVFPDGPVVRTQCFNCPGSSLDPLSGNFKISHPMQGGSPPPPQNNSNKKVIRSNGFLAHMHTKPGHSLKRKRMKEGQTLL